MTSHLLRKELVAASAVIPKGVAHLRLAGEVRTREFAFLTLPNFTLLAFSALLDPLRIANQLTQRPLYSWRIVSLDGKPTASSAGIRVDADQGLEPLARDATVVVCSGTDATGSADGRVLQWLRDHARHGGGIGAVCTGAYTLARAGLLGEESATVHWENQAAFRELFEVEPLEQLYVIGRKHFSCAGGEAGIDMMLDLIERDHGRNLSNAVADMCLHSSMRRPTDRQTQLFPPSAERRHPGVLRVIEAMKDNISTPLDQTKLARIFGTGERQLERCFKVSMGESPKSYYIGLRLQCARDLLRSTTMTILEVAVETGFSGRGSFSKAFKHRFGFSPLEHRR